MYNYSNVGRNRLQEFMDWIKDYWVVVVLFALLIAIIVGAGWVTYLHVTGIQEGAVYSKSFDPAACVTTMYPMTTSNGKTTTTVYYPQTHCHGDVYTLYIKQGDKTNWFEVPSDVWTSAQNGDWFSVNCYCFKTK